jgi:predicted RNA-binding Zn-ribbon protein involved in translation (DUF1610 family)
MLTYPCANCERDLEVDDDLAGQRVRCPHCGNVEVAPRRAARPQPVGATAAPRSAAAPPPPELERELARVHPVMLRARPVQGSLIILGILAGIGLAIASQTTAAFAQARWAMWVGIAIAAAGLIGLGVWKITTRAITVIITNRRTTVRRGLFSRATKELRHDQVQDIQITQTFPQRVLGVGRFGLDGGGTDDVEIVVDDMPDPARLRELVDQYRGHPAAKPPGR